MRNDLGLQREHTSAWRFFADPDATTQRPGFIILDFAPRWEEATSQLVRWVVEGKLKHRETIVEGLENAPSALNKLFDGANMGKLLVKVAV